MTFRRDFAGYTTRANAIGARGVEVVSNMMEFVLLTAAMLMAVFYYPLAIRYALGFSVPFAYEIELPAIRALTALSLPVLLTSGQTWIRDRWVRWCVVAYCICIAGATLSNSGTVSEVLNASGRILVPVALACSLRRISVTSEFRGFISVALAVIWTFNVVSCVAFGSVYGICGNQNWTAATTIATAPFAYTAFACFVAVDRQVSPVEVHNDHPQSPVKLTKVPFSSLVVLLIISLSALVVIRCGCRASGVAIAGYLLIWIGLRLSIYQQLIALSSVVVAGIVIVSTLNFDWQRIRLAEERIPMWQSTLSMIASRPCLGHGPDQYRKNFVDHRSTELKRKQIDAVNAHPHNEVMLTAANLGIPASAVWILFCFVAIRPSAGIAYWEAPRFSAITLIGHGMLDKSLAVSPSSIVFVLVLAILLTERMRSRAQKEILVSGQASISRAAILQCGFLVAASTVCLVYVTTDIYNRINSGYTHREAKLMCHLAGMTVDSDESKSLLKTSYLFRSRACRNVGTTLQEHLETGLFAGEILGLTEEARYHGHQILRSDSQFGFTNFMMARCSLRDAFDTSKSKSSRDANSQKAVEFLERQLQIHPFCTRVHEQLIVALTSSKLYSRACAADFRLSEVYSQRLKYVCQLNGLSLESVVNSWPSSGRLEESQMLETASKLTTHITFSEVYRIHTEFKFPTLRRVHLFLRRTDFQKEDLLFWNSIGNLHSEFDEVSSAEELLRRLKSVKIAPSSGDRFSWPWEVWGRQSGTPMEASCLLAAIAQRFGQKCVVLNVADNISACLKWNGDLYTIRLQDWRCERIAHDDWITKSADERLESLVGTSQTPCQTYVFVYPQALRHQNRALFEVLNRSGNEGSWPQNPYVTLSGNGLSFPELGVPEFAIEPFERLEFDLQ